MTVALTDPVLAGRIATVHGIKGWVKIQSFTHTGADLLNYQPWWLKGSDGKWQKIESDTSRNTPKGLQCHLVGVDDRDQAREYCQKDIYVERSLLPELEADEFYWHQLQGLKVISHFEGQQFSLGSVKSLLETGANDVLVVKGNSVTLGSIDNKERLIPYIDPVIENIDLVSQQIDVSWDPDF